MAFEFELPDVGEGVAEGELIEWHVAVGDHVDEDEVLADVETDKAVVDLPSPVAGTVRELHAEEGEIVPVGEVVVTIDVDGEVPDEDEIEVSDDAIDDADGGQASDEEQSSDDEPPASTGGRVFAPPNVRRLAREFGVDITTVAGSGPGGRITDQDVREAAGKGGSDDEEVASAVSQVGESGASDDGSDGDDGPKSAVSKRSEGANSAVSRADSKQSERKSATRKRSPEPDGQTATTGGPAERDQTLAAPSTRRLAREEGIDIDAVPTENTRDGKAYVKPEDVRAYVAAQQVQREGETAAASEQDQAGEVAATGAPVGATPETGDGEVTREPYRGVRRTIGKQMEQSVYTAPHVTHHDTAVVDELVATRAELKERAEARGVSLTYLPFVMKAVVAALKQFPVLNTTLDEDSEEVVYKHFYNIGVAVATDAGLMVPVVEDVDEKGIVELAGETADLADRARARDLTREEMQGGTFTITNFGAIGGEYATPVINYPETAILGLGSIEQRPTVVESETAQSSENAGDDAASTGDVVAAQTLPLSLSIDHRVIDGAEAARFANTVIEYLENPTLLLLE
ncbi:2-oxo acid dehydrogenase subunit E2 [Salinibaculum rarum]|uniref:2-oxo acid dehydrogenase subunit E2 n=1 Tax=Salinibaculum rarum TaxID=3058903 RepID=UPI00265D92E5|nr:2-oxo acid dehydrogenase subunit E2 [Salinibaculum sp. KK48]